MFNKKWERVGTSHVSSIPFLWMMSLLSYAFLYEIQPTSGQKKNICCCHLKHFQTFRISSTKMLKTFNCSNITWMLGICWGLTSIVWKSMTFSYALQINKNLSKYCDSTWTMLLSFPVHISYVEDSAKVERLLVMLPLKITIVCLSMRIILL